MSSLLQQMKIGNAYMDSEVGNFNPSFQNGKVFYENSYRVLDPEHREWIDSVTCNHAVLLD